MANTNKAWREFEQAVAKFAAAMDPCAKVDHDVKLPDRHSHHPRQRDVWIEAKICKHFPIAVLVGCKHWKKRVDQGHIDAFNGEIASSRAHKGVMYSYSGFTRPALKKATELGICCCRLFRDEPAEIPECLTFHAYHCRTRVSLTVSPVPIPGNSVNTWGDLFDLTVSEDGSETLLLDEIVRKYQKAESDAVQAMNKCVTKVPQPFDAEVSLPPVAEDRPPLRAIAHGTWKFYRAKLDAYLLKGSYSFTTGEYLGQIATPSVDRLSIDPGPGWEPLDHAPDDLSTSVIMLLYCGEIIRNDGRVAEMRCRTRPGVRSVSYRQRKQKEPPEARAS